MSRVLRGALVLAAVAPLLAGCGAKAWPHPPRPQRTTLAPSATDGGTPAPPPEAPAVESPDGGCEGCEPEGP